MSRFFFNDSVRNLDSQRAPAIPLKSDHNVSTTWILHEGADHKILSDYCNSFGLQVRQLDQTHLKVTGSADQFNRALEIKLEEHSLETGGCYHKPSSASVPSVPSNISGHVKSIIGLDTYPLAKPRFMLPPNQNLSRGTGPTFTPIELASLYSFPSGNGLGQTIGIIELGGGYNNSDLVQYFANLGISGSPNVTAVGVDGAVNDPSDTSRANYEVILDIDVIIAICPKAATRVYFAPNSSQGFYDAIYQAIADGCKAISISWGAAERYWTSGELNAYNALFQSAANANAIVTAASGDSGSSDGAPGNNVDFPASSPWVLACGGTTLTANSDHTAITSEVVWNSAGANGSTGGGLSTAFAKPTYQNTVTFDLKNKRGVPDIAGNANPNTGYIIYYNGSNVVIGGTSAVSPLWAALVGRIRQNIAPATLSGLLQTVLYANPTVCRDIISGNNGAFNAGSKWDACTGLGSPLGQAIQTVIQGGPAPPPPPSTPAPVAQFTANKVSGSGLLTVQFTDQSTNTPTSWLWRFGDGSTSTQKNPSHRFSKGTYTVSLTASNSGGSSTITKTGFIKVK